ncbi:MAG: hypothetical protein E6Q98_25620 [Rhodospirillaceae bacterium]|nr:MAG: hypothetical protein E6Q98_25620 [Rhodospirillaceae bacterium]
MDISSTIGIAATYEAARNAGVQQAASTGNSQEAQREAAKQAQELDLKRTDVVPGVNDQPKVEDTRDKRLDVTA